MISYFNHIAKPGPQTTLKQHIMAANAFISFFDKADGESTQKGLSKWLVETIMSHPDLQGLRRWILLTGDAHGLYRQFGWTDLADSTRWMELHNKNVYSNL